MTEDPYGVRERAMATLEAVRGVNEKGDVVYGPTSIPGIPRERAREAYAMKRSGAVTMQWLDMDLSLNGVVREADLTKLVDVDD